MDNQNVFIGVKSLSRKQVKGIVPTFDLIMKQILEMRVRAHGAGNNREFEEYDNTIGIFGARGTGKSCTLMTIKKILSKESRNIILETIKPDMLGENTTIMGAIIGLLKEEVEKIEDIIKNSEDSKTYHSFFNDCKFKKNNELRKRYKDVLEAYCYSENEYRKVLTSNFSDFESFKKNYSKVLTPDIQLRRAINKLYDIIIESKNRILEEENNDKKNNKNEAMIFIFMDDVDLKTSKCKEVIDFIMKYICHPNVVCILTADYEILSESLTLALTNMENHSKNYDFITAKIFDDSYLGTEKFSLLDRKKYLTYEYLKKIVPPAFRHNVVIWNVENIPFFSFASIRAKEKNQNFIHHDLIRIFGEKSVFGPLVTINKEHFKFLKTPYNIFDNTPRGIVNVYYKLNKFDNQVNGNKRFIQVKGLIETMISSSKELMENRHMIKDIIVWGTREISSKVDFSKLIKTNGTSKDIIDIPKVFMDKFVLGYITKELLKDIRVIGFDEVRKYFIYYLLKEKTYTKSTTNMNLGKVQEFIEKCNEENEVIKVFHAILKEMDLNFSIRFAERLLEENICTDIFNGNKISSFEKEKIFESIIYIISVNENYLKDFIDEMVSNLYRNDALNEYTKKNEEKYGKVVVMRFIMKMCEERIFDKYLAFAMENITGNMYLSEQNEEYSLKCINGNNDLYNEDLKKTFIILMMNTLRVYKEEGFEKIKKYNNPANQGNSKAINNSTLLKSSQSVINSTIKHKNLDIDYDCIIEKKMKDFKENFEKYIETKDINNIMVYIEDEDVVKKALKIYNRNHIIPKVIKFHEYVEVVRDFTCKRLIKKDYCYKKDVLRGLNKNAVLMLDMEDQNKIWEAMKCYLIYHENKEELQSRNMEKTECVRKMVDEKIKNLKEPKKC